MGCTQFPRPKPNLAVSQSFLTNLDNFQPVSNLSHQNIYSLSKESKSIQTNESSHEDLKTKFNSQIEAYTNKIHSLELDLRLSRKETEKVQANLEKSQTRNMELFVSKIESLSQNKNLKEEVIKMEKYMKENHEKSILELSERNNRIMLEKSQEYSNIFSKQEEILLDHSIKIENLTRKIDTKRLIIKEKNEEIDNLNHKIDQLMKNLENSKKILETSQDKLEKLKEEDEVLILKLKNDIQTLTKDFKDFKQHFILDKSNRSPKQLPSDLSYDMIININSLRSFNYGWNVQENKQTLALINKSSHYSVIGIVGRENSGKTYILNKICGVNLPSALNIHTEGLNMKYGKEKNLICLDSTGMQTMDKEDLIKNEEIRHKIIDDLTITDIFIQDFILDVCEVILIVVGQISLYDQKIIERISSKYKAKKTIIIIHNFNNLYSIEDVEKQIQKDIFNIFEIVERTIPETDIHEYIEINNDKAKQNIIHLVLGVDWCESGMKYNEKSIGYLQNILDTRVEKKQFDLIEELKKYMEENYSFYLHFKKLPKKGVSLKYDEIKCSLEIETDGIFEASSPIFNSLGSLITSPSYEVFERKDRYICLIELPDLKNDESLKVRIDKKGDMNNLIVEGIKNTYYLAKEDNNKVTRTRNYGLFSCVVPLGPIDFKMVINEEFKYEAGVLVIEVLYYLEDVL